MSSSGGWKLGSVLAIAAAFFLGAALGLLEEGREDAAEGDQQRQQEEAEAHGAPERGVAGRTGLLRDVGVGEAAGDQREHREGGGENEEVASQVSLPNRDRRQSGCAYAHRIA